MIAMVADSSFEPIENLSRTYPSRGLSSIMMKEVERGVQVFFDVVGPSGPQVRYGIVDADEGWLGLSNRLNLGNLHLIDRSPESSETLLVHTSAGGWLIRAVVDDHGPSSGGGMLDQIRHALGLDEQNFNILLGGIAVIILLLCTVILATMSARGIRWMRRRRSVEASGSVLLEEDVVDVVDEDDIAVSTSEDEGSNLVELVELEGGAELRRGRRQKRSRAVPVPEPPPMPASLPEPSADAPEAPPDPPELQLNKPVVCPGCDCRFETSLDVHAAKCPVCGENIAL